MFNVLASGSLICDKGSTAKTLAVDFFFILSGFVVGYAYDDRWKTMRIADFLKRRFIRLHPMVIIGALIGASEIKAAPTEATTTAGPDGVSADGKEA